MSAPALGQHDDVFQADAGNEDFPLMIGGYAILFNQFDLAAASTTIVAVEVNFPSNIHGSSTDVLIYRDDDLGPADATLLYRADGVPAISPSRPHVYVIDPPLGVSEDYILVGVAQKDRAIWCDETISGSRSWMAQAGFTGPPFNPADLSLADTLIQLDGTNPFGYNCTWHIRAYSSDGGSLDADGDGFEDGPEIFFGTDVHDACPDDPDDDAWPLDVNNDARVGITDVLSVKPFIFSSEGDANYNPRFDLNVSGDIGISDVLLFKPAMSTSCV